MSIAGAFLFIFLAILRLARMLQGELSLLGAMLFCQASLAALLMIFRRPVAFAPPVWVQALAWVSASLPLLMHTPARSPWQGLLPLPGLILNLWGLTCLGTAFGIAPAERGLVTAGPYRWLRHPMYAGELLSLVGAGAAAPSSWNLSLLLIFIASVLWRIDLEEHILDCNGYTAYAAVVRWRLLPGVW
jgi:hypothetical protein